MWMSSAIVRRGEAGRMAAGGAIGWGIRVRCLSRVAIRAVASKPSVQKMTQKQMVKALPWSGSGARLIKEVGTAEACTARVAASLVACALLYQNSVELAAAAALYWAWGPIWSTALSNTLLRLRYRYAGVWEARVLDVQVLSPLELPETGGEFLEGFFNKLPRSQPTLQLLLGDDSSASLQMEVVLTDDIPRVRIGEPVELLVMSDKPELSRFKALREVYFPSRKVWIAEEPSLEREYFERLSRTLASPFHHYEKRRSEKHRPEESSNRASKEWVKSIKLRPYAEQPQQSETQKREVEYQERIDTRSAGQVKAERLQPGEGDIKRRTQWLEEEE